MAYTKLLTQPSIGVDYRIYSVLIKNSLTHPEKYTSGEKFITS